MENNNSPIIWDGDKLLLLDQRLLPHNEKFQEILGLEDCKKAIKDMVVRGAPCIGFASIFGMALWVRSQKNLILSDCQKACDEMISARPTAVNLAYEVKNTFNIISKSIEMRESVEEVFFRLIDFGNQQIKNSHEQNLKMAKIGVSVLKEKYGDRKWNLMTHCNTGFLACGSLGTALGVISHAHSIGKIEHVYADETRPYMQGSRLTAYELTNENIPFSIVVEGAASYLMAENKIDAIFVGADRIALNGDTANKVGTSTLAIVAKHYKVPFYVVAPISSFDLNIPSGQNIEIEMRDIKEITHMNGVNLAPAGAQAINPSFDVTDHQLISGIICENGFINLSLKGDLERVVRG